MKNFPKQSGARTVLGLFILLAVLLPFWFFRVVSSGAEAQHPITDQFSFYYPMYLWNYTQWANGSFPLWNPYQLCGIPTLANLQSGLLYPPHLLYLVLPTHLAMALSSFVHLAFAGISTMVLARRLRLAMPAAILAAVLFCMRGGQPGNILNSSMQESGAWLALGLWAVFEVAQGRRDLGIILLALATGMSLLAGFPQLTVYSAYAWGFMLLALIVQARTSLRKWPPALLGGLAGIALGCLLAAVQIFPALELVAIGGRERGVLSLSMMFPFGFVEGDLFRAFTFAHLSRPSMPGVWLDFGIVGLLLLPIAFLRKPYRGLALGFLALGTLSLAFALGPATPLFDLYLKLPEVGNFRIPGRALLITDICFAMLAGIGLDALLRTGLSMRRMRLIPAIVMTLPVLAIIEIFVAAPNHYPLPYDRTTRLLERYHDEDQMLASLTGQPDRVWPWFMQSTYYISQKLPGVLGVRSIADREIMTLRRQSEYFSYLYWGETAPYIQSSLGHQPTVFYGHTSILDPSISGEGLLKRSRLVDLAAGRYLLSTRGNGADPKIANYVSRKGLVLSADDDPELVLFENPAALPRVYISHNVRRAPQPKDLLALISRRDFDPRELSYVDTEAEALPELMPAIGAENARIVVDDLHEVEINVSLSAPGLVVLADSYYPGWVAEVDGMPATILPTNHLFRGVRVPAGDHRVTFHYRPASVALGAALSSLGLVVFAALSARILIRSRREPFKAASLD
ncbi:YfhO family protein [Myxococcota bacterium]|nr:YfhO family protein [Myxococcota bacterium]